MRVTHGDIAIASTASQSDVIRLEGKNLLGLHLPAAIDGDAVRLLVSADDGATFETFADYERPIAAGRYIDFDPARATGVSIFKVETLTASAPQNQLAARALRGAYREVE